MPVSTYPSWSRNSISTLLIIRARLESTFPNSRGSLLVMELPTGNMMASLLPSRWPTGSDFSTKSYMIK